MNQPSIDIRLNGEGAVPELADKKVHRVAHFILTGLPAGMSTGRTSVALVIDLGNGEMVFAESSLRLFLAAADALRTKYGDQ